MQEALEKVYCGHRGKNKYAKQKQKQTITQMITQS